MAGPIGTSGYSLLASASIISAFIVSACRDVALKRPIYVAELPCIVEIIAGDHRFNVVLEFLHIQSPEDAAGTGWPPCSHLGCRR